MRRVFRWVLGAVLALGLVALLVWAFIEGREEIAREGEMERPVKAPSRLETQAGERRIKVDPDTASRSGIKVGKLVQVSRQGRVTGYGVALSLQDLLDLRGSLAEARAQAGKAQAILGASRKEYERLRDLSEDNRNVSAKALEAAEAAWRSDEAGLLASQVAVRGTEDRVRASWGEVILGWLMEASPELDRLASMEEVLVRISLPEGTVLTPPPPKALVKSPGSGLVSMDLISRAPLADRRIQGPSLFYRVAHEPSGILPPMSVQASLPIGPEVKGVVVPAAAVVFWEGKAWIYVQKGQEAYVRREVPTDFPIEEGWLVANATLAEASIVIAGAQALLSEEFRSKIQVGEE